MTFTKKVVFMICILTILILHCTNVICNIPCIKFHNKRHCEDVYVPYWHYGILQNGWILLLFLLFGLTLILVCLGILKGLIGLIFYKPIGMWGLRILVDLPRPLHQYQECQISHRPVKYDTIGWPIHPDTGERSVRILTKKMEFCLNVVFFLTYPLAIIHALCGLCCFRTTENGHDEDQCYYSVNKIVLTDCKTFKKKNKNGPIVDMYADDDPAEEEDTKYVLKQMRKSRESLQI